jgi:predicted branched-subunit amino acid permease
MKPLILEYERLRSNHVTSEQAGWRLARISWLMAAVWCTSTISGLLLSPLMPSLSEWIALVALGTYITGMFIALAGCYLASEAALIPLLFHLAASCFVLMAVSAGIMR